MHGRVAAMAAATVVLLLASSTPGAHADGPDSIVGIPASEVGIHGPVDHHLDGFDLVGHASIRPPGEPPAGNNGAPALVDDCAYVGRWHEYGQYRGVPQRGVQIVDVDRSSATFTEVVGEVAGSFSPGATSREIRAVDLPDFKLLVVMTFSDTVANRPDRELNTLRFFDASDCRNPVRLGTYDFLAARPHEFYLWLDPDPAHDVDGHPRILAYVSLPIQAPNLVVVDASDPTLPRPVAAYDAAQAVVSLEEEHGTYLGNYLHSVSVSPDGNRAFLSYWDGGFLTVDTSSLATGLPAGGIAPLGLASVPYDYSPPDAGNTHSAVKIPGQEVAVVGDEVFGGNIQGCPYGWMRLVALGSEAEAPAQIGEFRLDANDPANCDAATGLSTLRNAAGAPVDGTFSMHNQTVLPTFAFASWYGGGMRVVDVSDPTVPNEVGAFVPRPLASVRIPSVTRPVQPQGRTATHDDDWWVETWSYPVIRNGLVYVTDIRSGLFILAPSPGAPFAPETAATPFAEGNSNLGDLLTGS